jgi:hypothetical protein
MAYTSIDKSTEHFNTSLYAGDSQSTHAITGVGHQPDWVWLKYRGGNGNYNLWDVIRGVNNYIISNNGNAGSNDSTLFDSFDSDGFTVGNGGIVNDSGRNYVGWSWKAGGSGSSNTDGNRTSTVSVNTTAGFSIVKYTGNESAGATVGHGLGVAPDVIIVKNYAVTKEWNVYHSANTSTPQNDYLILNEDNATNSNSGRWNNTAPSSSIFTLGDGSETNGSGNTHIAYCFAEKKGFSKFGSYTGNGSTDGIFVYTGFKPAFTLIKKSSASGTWWEMVDNKRSPSNVMDNTLYANVTNSEFESSAYNRDFVSNGFKIRNTNGGDNTSGATYVYMAFAETPFVTSTGIPTTAK